MELVWSCVPRPALSKGCFVGVLPSVQRGWSHLPLRTSAFAVLRASAFLRAAFPQVPKITSTA
jgi:hypothetical protein